MSMKLNINTFFYTDYMFFRGEMSKISYDNEKQLITGEVLGLTGIACFSGNNKNDLGSAMEESLEYYLKNCSKKGVNPYKEKKNKILNFSPKESSRKKKSAGFVDLIPPNRVSWLVNDHNGTRTHQDIKDRATRCVNEILLSNENGVFYSVFLDGVHQFMTRELEEMLMLCGLEVMYECNGTVFRKDPLPLIEPYIHQCHPFF